MLIVACELLQLPYGGTVDGLCLQELLRVNIRQNLHAVIQIATKYSDILALSSSFVMFESFKTFEGIATWLHCQI